MQLLPEYAQKEVFNYLLFVKSRYIEKSIPKKDKPQRPSFGCGSVNISLSKDFDEPLEDFKDYM